MTTGFYGKAIELIYEIRTIESPTRLELSVEGGRASGRNEIVVEQMVVEANGSSSDVGSIISYRLTIELKGVARLLDRGLQLALNGRTGGWQDRQLEFAGPAAGQTAGICRIGRRNTERLSRGRRRPWWWRRPRGR